MIIYDLSATTEGFLQREKNYSTYFSFHNDILWTFNGTMNETDLLLWLIDKH